MVVVNSLQWTAKVANGKVGKTEERMEPCMEPPMDPVNATLWALAGYDRALEKFAELRAELPEGPVRIAMDRALVVYLNAQTETLMHARYDMGLGRDFDYEQSNQEIINRLGADQLSLVMHRAASLSDDPLMQDIGGYAMCLGALTAWGTTPWRRYATVVDHLFFERTGYPV